MENLPGTQAAHRPSTALAKPCLQTHPSCALPRELTVFTGHAEQKVEPADENWLERQTEQDCVSFDARASRHVSRCGGRGRLIVAARQAGRHRRRVGVLALDAGSALLLNAAVTLLARAFSAASARLSVVLASWAGGGGQLPFA
eukprot:768791-Hanusia_phi.AAC.3